MKQKPIRMRILLREVVAVAIPSLILIFVALLMAGFTTDPTYSRTIYTVDTTMVLLTGAICLYLFKQRALVVENLWLLFWSFAYLGFLVHIYCAVFGTFDGDIRAVFHSKEKVSHPIFDFVLAFWWGIDVLLAWVLRKEPRWTRLERAAVHLVLFVAFVLATREPGVSQIGRSLGLILFISGAASALIRTVLPSRALRML